MESHFSAPAQASSTASGSAQQSDAQPPPGRQQKKASQDTQPAPPFAIKREKESLLPSSGNKSWMTAPQKSWMTVDKTANKTPDKTTDKTTDKPAGKPAGKISDETTGKTTNKRKRTTTEKTTNKPASKAAANTTANMSNGFDRQQASFLSSMSAAASKIGTGAGTKRSLAPPSPSPSIGSTTSAAAAGSMTPRKDRDTPAGGIVYSQPALTGTGDSIISQMAYAVSWLRGKDEPQTCIDVLGYLSATARPEKEQEFFVDQMRRHPQIQWIPDPSLSEQTWRSGTYAHRAVIPDVKTKTQLLAHLQKKTDASGVSVKDLKDGWPDCEAGINELEREHKVLVIRAKKDGAAKTVWLDDASLFHEVDPQLKLLWSRVEVPSVENIVPKLVAAQQKPASEDPRLKANQAPKTEKKKKRAQRRTGKSTNVHMEHLLKDYSHMKR
jgi:transcription initiation factor TFIIE subunit beta